MKANVPLAPLPEEGVIGRLDGAAGAEPTMATREVDELAATAVNPGPSTIWVPARMVALALLASETEVQLAPVQLVTVEVAVYVPVPRVAGKFRVCAWQSGISRPRRRLVRIKPDENASDGPTAAT